MSIEKRNTGYTVRWRDASGRQRSQQVARWRDAVALDGEIKRQKALGELALRDRGATTLEDFWELTWWPRHRDTLSPSAQQSYEIAWRRYIQPKLGRYPLNQLTGQECMKLSEQPRGRTLSAATIRKHYTVLQAALSAAVAWGYCATNPAAGVKKPPLPQSRGIALGQDEVEALVDEFDDERSKAIVRLLAYTGLRPGELRNLQWRDCRDDSIVVRQSKTGIPRSVVLSARADQALLIWRVASRGSAAPWRPVFPGRNGSTWTEAAYKLWVRRRFVPAARRAGFAGLRAYDLRHTFVSDLIAAGRNIYWIARQAGHSPEVALRTYAHLLDDQVGAPDVRRSAVQGLKP